MPSILTLITWLIAVINGYLVPLVFAISFITFLFGVSRMFIGSNGDAKKIAEGRQFVLWSVIGFAVMIGVWGLVNLVFYTFPLVHVQPGIPQFNEQQTGAAGVSGGNLTPVQLQTVSNPTAVTPAANVSGLQTFTPPSTLH